MNLIYNSRRIRILLAVTVLLLTAFCVFSLKTEAAAATEADCGAIYEISEDGTYVIIIGYAEAISNIDIPAELEGLPVREVAKSAFAGNAGLYSISLPDTVTYIGEGAFRNCRSLVSVRLPAGLTELPYECFSYCTVLSRITLPDTLVSIDDFCFEDCTKLGSLKIPASLTNIGYDAFIHCESLWLDVSENAYAAEYAEANGLVTSFKDSSLYFWHLIGIGTLIAVTLAFICLLIYYAWLRRHPEKNPNIFIFRVFGKIYAALSKAYRFIAKWLLLILSFIIYWISFAVKWVISKLPKRKAKKKNRQSSETD